MIVRSIFFFFVACLGVFLGLGAWAAQYDKPYLGEMTEHIAVPGDTFIDLARTYNVGFVEMRAANPEVDPWSPMPGTPIVLPTRNLVPDAKAEGIVINLPEMRVYFFPKSGEPVSFPIGIGREGLETPTGITHIRAKMKNPTWRPTDRMRQEDPSLPEAVPPGPDNPLGTHILYLGWDQYGIHGTAKPLGVGRRVSSGCIRVDPRNIPILYEKSPVGTRVEVVNQPIKAAWIDGVLYVEVTPTMGQSFAVEDEGKIEAPTLSPQDWARLNAVIGDRAKDVDWVALRAALRTPLGYPVPVTALRAGKPLQNTTTNTVLESNKEVKEIQKQTLHISSS